MKKPTSYTIIIIVLFFTFWYRGSGNAFHSGGVAECEGCHTMHNSLDGVQMTTEFPQYQAGPYLLKATDQGSACLNCHQHAGDTGPTSYHISTADADMPTGIAPLQMTPGGDFAWLKKTYSWVPRSGAQTEYSNGERHGHNIIASDYGYTADSTQTISPGGSYPAANLTCISCHDPHGRYRITAYTATSATFATGGKPIKSSGSYGATPDATFAIGTYRLLAGKNYAPESLSSYPFAWDPIVAVAPNSYNRSEATSDTRVSYGRDVAFWCANCHEQMHSVLSGGFVHRAGEQLNSTVANDYNRYRKTGDISGTISTAYLSLVPFQVDNSTNIPAHLTLTTSTAGAAFNDRVMCLTCHRAHASGWDSMVRFSLGNEFMTLADSSGNPIWPDPAVNPAQAQGRTIAETQAAYYGRPATKFAAYQRVPFVTSAT